MADQKINELIDIYGMQEAEAIEVAMFAVDLVLSYRNIYNENFWMEAMDYMDNRRLS